MPYYSVTSEGYELTNKKLSEDFLQNFPEEVQEANPRSVTVETRSEVHQQISRWVDLFDTLQMDFDPLEDVEVNQEHELLETRRGPHGSDEDEDEDEEDSEDQEE